MVHEKKDRSQENPADDIIQQANEDYEPQQPTWAKWLPLGAGVGAGAVLLAGSIYGFRRPFKKQQDAPPDGAKPTSSSQQTQHAFEDVEEGRRAGKVAQGAARGNSNAGRLAFKAFVYGTALCVGVTGSVSLALAWYLDIWSIEEASDYLALRMPNLSQKTRKGGNSGDSDDFGLGSSDPTFRKIQTQLKIDEQEFQKREQARRKRMEKMARKYYDENQAKARVREKTLYAEEEEDGDTEQRV